MYVRIVGCFYVCICIIFNEYFQDKTTRNNKETQKISTKLLVASRVQALKSAWHLCSGILRDLFFSNRVSTSFPNSSLKCESKTSLLISASYFS